MLQTIPMSDTFELPEGLKDFPKVLSVAIDPRNNIGPSICGYGGQDYYHWSILNTYVNKAKYDSVTSEAIIRLSKLLTKVDEGNIDPLDLKNDIKECMIALCK